MRRSFIEAVANRHSYYLLGNSIKISNAEILSAIDALLLSVPSPFNIQSARLVVLLGDQHTALWDIVESTLKPLVDAEQFKATQHKLHNAFRAGYGTILFYEDEEKLDELRKIAPKYAEHVSSWSEQSSGMLQFAIWTALEDMGLGASLQHYNPLIDDAVRRCWLIDKSWRLIAQMPFGSPEHMPEPHAQRSPIGHRRLIFGLNDK